MTRRQHLPPVRKACFVIGPIKGKGSATRLRADAVLEHVIKPAVKSVGLLSLRSDEIQEPGSLHDQLVTYVVGSPAAVADLTDLNENALWELGLRDAQLPPKPTILIAERGQVLPFDLSHANVLFFDHRDIGDVNAAQKALRARLRAAVSGQTRPHVSQAALLRGAAAAEGDLGDGVTVTWEEVVALVGALRRRYETTFKPDLVLTMSGPGSIVAHLAQSYDPRDVPVVTATTFPRGSESSSAAIRIFGGSDRAAGHRLFSTLRWLIYVPSSVFELPPGSKVLLLDDRVISGESQRLVRGELVGRNIEVATAALIAPPDSSVDFVARRATGDFTLPWGTRDGRSIIAAREPLESGSEPRRSTGNLRPMVVGSE